MTDDREIMTIQTFDDFRDFCVGRRLNVSQIADLAAKIKFVWVIDCDKYTPDSLLDALARFHETYTTHDSRPIWLDCKLIFDE
jgi:hypothetical protein